MTYSLYIIIVLASAIISLALAAYAWQHRDTRGAVPFGWLMLGAAGWALALVFKYLSRTPETSLFWSKVRYMSVVAVPLAWVVFALQYTGARAVMKVRQIAGLAAIQFITALLVWTNEAHGLVWRSIDFQRDGFMMLSVADYGAWYWVHIAYSYSLMLGGIILIVRMVLRSARIYRRQAIILLSGALAPALASIPLALGVINLDVTPLGLAVTGPAFAWAVFRYHLLDLVPTARDALVECMSDGVIVLDNRNRIVDLNAAAQSIIGLSLTQAVGQPATEALSFWRELIDIIHVEAEMQLCINLDTRGTRRYYEVQVSLLTDQRGHLNGKMIILRDTTEQKRAEIELQDSERKLADIINFLPDATFVIDEESKVIAWNRAMEGMTGFKAENMLGKGDYEYAIPFYDERRMILIDLVTEPREGFEQKYTHIQRHGNTLTGENYVPHLHGGRYLVGTAAGLYDFEGNLVGAIETIRDITERKEAESALRESRRQLEASFQREQERRKLSDTLREVARIVSSSLEQDRVLDLIIAQLKNVITYHYTSVTLLSDSELTLVAGRDYRGNTMDKFTIAVDEYPLNAAALRQKYPVLVPDVHHADNWNPADNLANIRSFINAPLLVQDRPIGLLFVGREDNVHYTAEDSETVFAFASQVAVALEQARLHEYEMAELERELEIARQIQISLLPLGAPELPGLEIADISQPARQVGGDFYNYFVFDEGKLGVVIGDVSGKGMQAALMMSLSFGILSNEVRRELSPAVFLEKLNRKLWYYTQRNKLNTALAYLVLEPHNDGSAARWELQAGNAGVISPLLRYADGTVEWLDVSGFPLGVMFGTEYQGSHQLLSSGDVLILSSDGVVETMNARGELYSFDRLMKRVETAPRGSAWEILEWILGDVRGFVGDAEPHDDMTLIVMRFS